jgi:carbon-monoxide dehydrogenase medium subunit
VKPPPFEYHRADSVQEAVALLAELGDEAKVLAGGQSLVPLLSLRLARPAHLVDVNPVVELAGVDATSSLRLGAMVRHRTAERSDAVRVANPLLADAVAYVGHAAIRNRGTVGGSIAHADPAAELPTVLVALDAEVQATSVRGDRSIPAAEFFQGFLVTALEPDELLTAVVLAPWPAGAGWSFMEFSRRNGDFAIAGVAVMLQLGADGRIEEARLAFSGMGGSPLRAAGAEASLAGQAPSPELFAEVGRQAVAELDPPSDVHGTTAYRRHLAGVLAARALTEAHGRSEVAA